MKLATKLVILSIVLSMTPLAILGFLAYREARITVEDQTFRFLTATNILKQSEFTRWLENDALVLVLLAQRPTLMQLTAELIQPDGSTAATNNLEELRNLQAYRDLLKVHLLPVSDTLGGFETLSIIRAA